jgi:hypothetical protein
MSRLENLLVGALLLVGLLAAGWFGLDRYGAARYDAGYTEAIELGKQQLEHETLANRRVEADLRSQLSLQDATAYRKEQDHAASLEAAQRRVRAGTDRLRCPAGTVQPATAAADRPAAGGPAPDGEGPEFVPDTAAALLGDAADVAGLVRRYDRLVERFEACRALNAK